MKSQLVVVIVSTLLLAATGTAFAQEISIICEDTNGNFFSAVKGDRVDCSVDPSEITPDGPGRVTVTDPNGKTVIDMAANQNGVTSLSFIAKKTGTYEITATWDVDGQPHSAVGHIIVSKKH